MRDTFDGWPEEKVLAFMEENLYLMPRQLADGEWVAMHRLAFTWSICCDITPQQPFKYRWCFADKAEALYFLETIVDYDEVPVRKTSLKGHRYRDEPLYREKDAHGFDKW